MPRHKEILQVTIRYRQNGIIKKSELRRMTTTVFTAFLHVFNKNKNILSITIIKVKR